VLAGDFELAALIGEFSEKAAFWMASADCVANVRSNSMVSGGKSPGAFRVTARQPIR